MPKPRRTPHPLAWILVAAVVLAIVAAALAPDRAPAVALYGTAGRRAAPPGRPQRL